MKRIRSNQFGFEAAGIIVALLIVTVISVISFKVIGANKDQLAGDEPSVASQSQVVAVPETIETQADLAQAGKALDGATAELDSGLDDTELDADLKAML